MSRSVWTLLAASLVPLRAAEISGLVVDPGGAIIVGADVTLGSGGVTRKVRSDLNGFHFENLPAGLYLLVGHYVESEYYVARVTVEANQNLDLGQISIRFGPDATSAEMKAFDPDASTGVVFGEVLGFEDRSVLPLAVTELRCVEAAACKDTRRLATGNFRFEDLLPGRYEITVSLAGHYTETSKLRVFAGLSLDLGAELLWRCSEPSCDPAKRPREIHVLLEE